MIKATKSGVKFDPISQAGQPSSFLDINKTLEKDGPWDEHDNAYEPPLPKDITINLKGSTAAYKTERSRGIESTPWIFVPNDYFMQHWDVLMLFLLIYTSFVTTYEVAFMDGNDSIDWGNVLFLINFCVTIGFLIDMAVTLNLAYSDPNSGLLITSRCKIFRHYCKGMFLMDIISTFPWGWLPGGGSAAAMRLIRLLRLVKLLRILRASRIINRTIQASSLRMSTWAFIRTGILLLLCIHWSSCLWYSFAQVDPENNWKINWEINAFEGEEGEDDEDTTAPTYAPTYAPSSAGGRYLKASAAAKSGGSKAAPIADWYYVATSYTLSIFGIWPFDSTPPATLTEGWFTIIMTIIAASFYAYLAGVVVDLVAQRGDAAREINGLLDGLLVYLDCIDFPSARTRHFKRFFWLCRPYLLRNYFRELLPELSPKLNGELAKFNYGKMFAAVHLFNCTDEAERELFQTALAGQLETNMFVDGERVSIDYLAVVMEGLLTQSNFIFRKDMAVGVRQCIDPKSPPITVIAMTFVACSVCTNKALAAVLETGQYPLTQSMVNKAVSKLVVLRVCKGIVKKLKNADAAAKREWGSEAMKRYKDQLVGLSNCPRHKRAAIQATIKADQASHRADAVQNNRFIAHFDVRTEMDAAFAEEDEELSTDDSLKLVLQRLESLSADIAIQAERTEEILIRQKALEDRLNDDESELQYTAPTPGHRPAVILASKGGAA